MDKSSRHLRVLRLHNLLRRAKKIVICHKTDEGTFVTIEMTINALADHLGHGDIIGGCPCPGTPPTVDYAGQVYNTVLIGSQCWLKENLNVGTMINGSGDQANNSTIEKYCYGNNSANCDTYGGLYQWNEAMQYVITEGAQGICPPGWHIPTRADFDALIRSVRRDANALKAIGQGTGDGAGTNTSGFSGLLAGLRSNSGNFVNLGGDAYVWSSTQYSATNAHILFLSFADGNFYQLALNKNFGFSVRCLKD